VDHVKGGNVSRYTISDLKFVYLSLVMECPARRASLGELFSRLDNKLGRTS